MTDFTKTTNFTAKDALLTGDTNKLIKGSEFDTEFDAIAVASATKYDSGDLSSQSQAEDLTLDTVLITPHTLNDVLIDNDGILADLQAIDATGNDVLLAYDFGTTTAKGFTLGTGLVFNGDTVEMDFLGLEDLVDPDADRVLFWDDSEGKLDWLAAGTGISVTTTSVDLTDVVAGAALPIVITSGVFTFDLSSITEISASGLSQSADGVVISDAGVIKVMPIDESGVIVQAAQSTQTLGLTDANTLMEVDGTATFTIPLNATIGIPVGAVFVFVVDHATQVLTITADTSVTLNSVFHPGGGSAASDTVRAGGTAVLIKIAADEWYLSGDITT